MLLTAKLASLAALLAAVAPVPQFETVTKPPTMLTGPASRSITAATHQAPSTINLAARGAKSVNDCDESAFFGETTSESPMVKHCQQLAWNIRNGGTWTIETVMDQNHQLAQYRSCAFSAHALDATVPSAHIGNQDIIDLITTSVARFARDGLVAAHGYMACQTGMASHVNVTWGIYYNE